MGATWSGADLPLSQSPTSPCLHICSITCTQALSGPWASAQLVLFACNALTPLPVQPGNPCLPFKPSLMFSLPLWCCHRLTVSSPPPTFIYNVLGANLQQFLFALCHIILQVLICFCLPCSLEARIVWYSFLTWDLFLVVAISRGQLMVLLSKYMSLEILVEKQALEAITWSLLMGVSVVLCWVWDALRCTQKPDRFCFDRTE